jgi:hypothetical protein
MIQCPKCSFDNELGRIFCHQCGNKLDLDQVKAPSEGAKLRRRVSVGVRKTVRTVIELVVAIAIIACVVLIWLVPAVPELKPTNADLVGSDVKKRALDHLVNGRSAGSLEITQGELNTYVNSLGFDKSKGVGMEFVPVTMHIEMVQGGMKIVYLGEIHLGDSLRKQLYLGLSGTPAMEQGSFEFKPTGAWIGALPIHPKLLQMTGLFQKYFGSLFSKLDTERDALNKLTSVTVGPGKVVLDYQPPAGK